MMPHLVPKGGINGRPVMGRVETHERVVRNDNTFTFKNLVLQLPQSRHRTSYAARRRCINSPTATWASAIRADCSPVMIQPVNPLHPSSNKERAANTQRAASQAVRRVATNWPTPTQNPHFSVRTPAAAESAGGKMPVTQPPTPTQQEVT